ncbi:hypothetical protein HanHA300_Chr15g0562131 [Helianthus annuus]|nr:hypothetical protein HanHA300_Chr15g0562131 [Helianthus annuus]KAJ0472818.1 hypothetical protein HanHA89_Chr15g0611331 [Helianthus annuus]KAJ0648426.1 hypothetical protein HanLR1_Chr15g0572751 [Helianthus annuus]KAJ0652255.1 hypothetical protein HanOQP8_Chr15g0570091 [Helianthus annuus]
MFNIAKRVVMFENKIANFSLSMEIQRGTFLFFSGSGSSTSKHLEISRMMLDIPKLAFLQFTFPQALQLAFYPN